MRKVMFLLLLLLIVGGLGIGVGIVVRVMSTQTRERIQLTMSVPSFSFNERILDAFLEEHPNIDVQFTLEPPGAYYASLASGIETHLNDAQRYVENADVMFVSSTNFSLHATRAGYFLDLAPLISGDASLDVVQFDPDIWSAFQWDQGTWALPLSTRVIAFAYRPDAFDEVGLAYPDADWTLDNLQQAMNAFSNANPGTSAPSIITFEYAHMLLRSLLEAPLYTTNGGLVEPFLETPETEALFGAWSTFVAQGQVIEQTANPFTLPMMVVYTDVAPPGYEFTMLPGGDVALDVQGFAINSATKHPELAYELVRYLTTNPQILGEFFSPIPAYQPLVELIPANPLTTELLAGADERLTLSDWHFTNHLVNAAENSTGRSLTNGLQESMSEARDWLMLASNRRQTAAISAPTAVPTLAPDEIALEFGGIVFLQNPYDPRLQAIVSEFVEQDPEVGAIDFIDRNGIQEDTFERADCYYLSYNPIRNGSVDQLVDLTSLIEVDSTLNLNDFSSAALDQVQRDGRIYGLPYAILPTVIWYDETTFRRQGVPLPSFNWTYQAFISALSDLDAVTGEDEAVFIPPIVGPIYLLMLAAANDVLLFDYRTQPAILNLTSAEAVAAVQQLRLLIQSDYVYYAELGIGSALPDQVRAPIESYPWDLFRPVYQIDQSENREENIHRLANFPSGSAYNPVSYEVASAYINSDTQHVDACYRWISHLSRQLSILTGIPARRSLLDSDLFTQAHSADESSFYRDYVAMIEQPQTVLFPSQLYQTSKSSLAFIAEMHWLAHTLNDIMLNDADIETALHNLQTRIEEYRQCYILLEPSDEVRQVECVELSDPELAQLLTSKD